MNAKEALENIKESLADYREYAIDCLPHKAKRIREENNDDFKIVETALNRLEELESQDQVFIFSGRMGGKQNLIVKKFQAFDKLEKVLKIIKEKNIDINVVKFCETYSEYLVFSHLLTETEFNLLKEYFK